MMYSTFPSVIFVANIYYLFSFFSFINILNQFFVHILYIFDNLVLFLSFKFLFFNLIIFLINLKREMLLVQQLFFISVKVYFM